MRRPLVWSLVFACCGLAGLAAQAQAPGVVKPAGKEPTVSIGGLLQVQAEAGDRGDSRFGSDNDRFYLRRARINATGKFLEEFDFRIEGDFAGTLSNTSSLRAQLTDGFVTWNRYPAAKVRMGQFKTPYGFEQLYGDPRLFSLERSLVNDRLTLSRQLGFQVFGELWDERLSYAVGAFNGNGANSNFNDDDRFLLAGRVAGVPWQGTAGGQRLVWSAGANAYTSDDSNVGVSGDFGFDATPATAEDDNVFSGTRRGFGFDTQVQWGQCELWVEVLKTRWEPDSLRPRPEVDSSGWYVLGRVYLVPDKLQALVKLESFDPRDDVDDTAETATLGLTWLLKGDELKVALNYLRTAIDNQPDQDKVLARFQVSF